MMEQWKARLLAEIDKESNELSRLNARHGLEGWLNSFWLFEEAVVCETKVEHYKALLLALNKGRISKREDLADYLERLVEQMLEWLPVRSTDPVAVAIDVYRHKGRERFVQFIRVLLKEES